MARWFALAVIFGCVALLSLAFTKFAGRVAIIWPANAILLAYILQRGGQVPSTLISGWVGNVVANLLTGDPTSRALVLSSINSFEIGLCYTVMTWGGRRPIDLTQPRQLAYFVVGAGLATPAVAAGIAATFLTLRGESAFLSAWVGWWLSDALGLIIFTPAVLVLLDGIMRQSRSDIDLRKGSAYFAALLAVLCLVFLQSRLPILYLVPATLALITFQMGLYGGALGLLLTAVFSNVALIAGLGPTSLVSAVPEVRVLNLQFFLAFLALTTLPLASVLGVRRRFEAEISAQRDHAEATAKALARTNAIASLAEQMAGLGYWVEDTASGVRRWSDEMYRIYGLDAGGERPTQDQELSFYHPKDRAPVRDILDPRPFGPAQSGTYRLDIDGQSRRVITSSRRLVHEDGSSVCLGVLVDVTRLYRAEEDLAASKTRYERLANLIPDLIISHDAALTITYASSAASSLGYDPEELVGCNLADFVHPDDLSAAVARAHVNTAKGPLDLSIRREQRVRTKSGDWVWLEGRPTQIPDADGAAREVLVALRDVSARRALEDALGEARTQAERALKIKTEFLANMSHELRTPLTAIVGFSGLLRGVGRLQPREARFAERIETASSALLSLVDDVLDLSRLESGGCPFAFEPFDASALAEEVIDFISTQAQAKNLAVQHDVEAFTMIGDRARTRQILVNLLGNAVKFTSIGEVRLKARQHGDQVCFAVSDTGPGIPVEAQARIFERFTQVDGASTRAFGGAGLGLAISQSLALAMHGSLSLTSQPGEGACFELWLPRTVAEVGP